MNSGMPAKSVAAAHTSPFHAAKRETALYYLDYLLPEASLCLARIRAGQNPLPQLSPASA